MKTLPFVRLSLFGALALCAQALPAATWYVATNGNDSAAGTLTAPLKTIQKGVDKAADGDTVLVAPGVYETGEQVTKPASGKSRVAITKNVVVRSTAGAARTYIVGKPHSKQQGFGTGSVRCVYMTAGTLDGFSLFNGFANAKYRTMKKDTPIMNGGGIFAPVNNRAPQVNNCIIAYCGAYRGGGAHWATLNNCTVVSNYVNTTSGDGVWGSLVRNSIVYYNGNQNYASGKTVDETVFQYSCTTPAPGLNRNGFDRDGGNNITNPPLFQSDWVYPATNSPCLNAGNNAFASGTRDAAGNSRILGGVVDMGAYESTFVLYPLNVIYGSGSGNYTAGSVVPIVARTPPAWAYFTGWEGDTAIVAEVLNPSTTVLMPAAPATVQATYHVMSVGEILSALLDLPDPVTTFNVTKDCISLQPSEVRLGPVADEDNASVSGVYTNAGTLIFPWRVSCEPGYDRFSLLIDGTEVAAITGEASGVVTQFVAGAGAHTIKWVYSKDGSDFNGQDCGWLGKATWIPSDLAAELGVPDKPIAFPYGQPGNALPFPYGYAGCFLDTSAPLGAIGAVAVKLGGITNGIPLVVDGKTVGMEVVLNGAGELSFQWRSSSQASDYLICSIDGAEAARISGTKEGWKTFTTNLLIASAHTLRWSYAKNASGISGLDCGWIDSISWKQFNYRLTVENGSGTSTNAVGATVTIVAAPPPAGYIFEAWDGDTENIVDIHSPTTTLVMPGRDITVRAIYKAQVLSVTVVSGRDAGAWPNEFHESTGEPEGVYPVGTLVRIIADPAPLWQTFDHWSNSVPVTYTDALADISMFVMPTSAVIVRAIYRPQTESEKLSGALTIKGQPLLISSFSASGVVAEATGGIRYNDPVVRFGGPAVSANQFADLTITNFTGDGVLLFWVSASAESTYDRIQVLNNGHEINNMRSPKCGEWHASTNYVWGTSALTIRFKRDGSYFVRNNTILVDRVIWIPRELIDAVGFPGYAALVPNINAESSGFDGEDGGVAWANDAPGGGSAIRFGRFGYVNNSQHAQLAVTNASTGILTWEWSASSEANYDYLKFFVDTVVLEPPLVQYGKEMVWEFAYHAITNLPNYTREENMAMTHKFRFDYSKDADVSVFNDCTWLRNGKWTPTFMLSLSMATITHIDLESPFDWLPEVQSEIKSGLYPKGTRLTIKAQDVPGRYFGQWEGSAIRFAPGCDKFQSPTTLIIWDGDAWVEASYTTNPPSSSASATVAKPQITGIAMAAPAMTAKTGVKAAYSVALPPAMVALSFEGALKTDYRVLFSPTLTGPACVWRELPVLYSEVQGDSAEGRHQFRVYVEAPEETQQGFFRLQPR